MFHLTGNVFIISKSEMLLDGVPNELINTWLDKDIITPFR